MSVECFAEWVRLYTNGTLHDVEKLPQQEQDKLYDRYMEDSQGPYGQPDTLIDVKRE